MKALKRILLAALVVLAASALANAQQGGSSTGGGGGSGGGQGGGAGQGGSAGAGGNGGPSEQGEGQSGGNAAGGQQMPPPAVTVQRAEARTIPITYEYAARVAASREVEVRARVGGIILERSFEEGSRVAANQVLFRIDPREYQAQVQSAQAAIAQAQAQLTNARRTEDRQRQLVQSGASSTATLDEAVANRQLAEAQLASANAQLYTANLSLTFATVNAPVGGITSREQVPEGSLVNASDLLTRVSQLDPIYVNFSAADTEAFQIRRLIENGAAGDKGVRNLTAEVVFGDGSTYDRLGTIDFTSATIDADTGTISSRAVFANPQQQLLPGQFVRIAIRGLVLENAIEIPATALMQNPAGQYVFTIDDKNVAQVRPITVGREMNERIIVASGLNSGDRVVTEGVVKVRPGAPVQPTEAPAQATNQQPSGGANTEQAAGGSPSGSGAAEGANQPQRTNGDGSAPASDSASGISLGSGVQSRGPAQSQGGGPVDTTGSGANNENVKAGQAGTGAGGAQ